MTDIAELHDLERKLKELKDLPEREQQAQAEAQRQQARQNLAKYEDDLQTVAGQFHAGQEDIGRKKSDLLEGIDGLLSDIKNLNRIHESATAISKQLGQVKCQLGLGTWGNVGQFLSSDVDHESQVAMVEAGIKPGLEEYQKLTGALLDLRSRLAPPKPKSPLEGKMLIVGHNGEQYWG